MFPARATPSSLRWVSCFAAGASLPDAVRIANQAAGVVVGKLGTAVVQPHELQ
jgi:bifunctional ADP-heptose synthase (sugar kinase/adenylyltransferase)